MKNAFKILFSSFLLLCSCQSGSGTKTLIQYTEEPGYSVPTHYSIGTLHFREEKVEEEFGLLPPYHFVNEKSYLAVSFYNGQGEKIDQFSWEEGEKVLFG
ncbi:MAG: hypothetical protein PUA93_02405 [Eubacteriales bacterium]|nr:hypothetical protein [Eubacteriales bacterium]